MLFNKEAQNETRFTVLPGEGFCFDIDLISRIHLRTQQ
jgi:hypothetical protein